MFAWAALPAAAQTLRLQNLAPFPRREGVAVVVPFAPGQVATLPELHVPGQPTAWQPFGARWPDGSVRQALCLFAADLPAVGEVELALVAGAGPTLPTGAIAMPAAKVEFVATRGGAAVRAEPSLVELLEDNALRRVELRRTRIGATGLIGELIVTGWRDQPHAWVEVAVFFSDPTTPAMQCQVDELAIEATGMGLFLRHPGRHGLTQAPTDTGSRAVLLAKSTLGDGQGLRRAGVLVPALRGDQGAGDRTLQAAVVCPPLGATHWQDSRAFGAFGALPLPDWLTPPAIRGVLAARHRAFAQGERAGGDPFEVFAMGLAKNPGQTGDQQDFGVVKLAMVPAAGLPSLLLECEPAVLQEACRPVHFRAADGSPIGLPDHPQWVVWSGRTHWHIEVSPDRLGKPHPQPAFERHGWAGKDREHWSSNYLGAFAQLTGAHWARQELANEALLYLAGQTLDPKLTTSHAGATRGAGRTELAATWMYLCTGDEVLRERMRQRLERVYLPEWAGRSLAAEQVRPMSVQNPDARLLQGKVRYWTPWQDGLAAVGFGAAFAITGSDAARELAEELALNMVRHGWKIDDRECVVATAMRWQDGRPLTEAELGSGDPTAVLWSYGTAFSQWVIGAVEIARVAALARGDAALAARAAEIQMRVRAARKKPADGGPDRLSEWDAVVWPPPGRELPSARR